MKKVLLVSYYFTKEEDIASIRLNGLAKYLPNFGWEPTILTSTSPSKLNRPYTVIETTCEDLIIKRINKFSFNADKPVDNLLKSYKKKNKKGILENFMSLGSEIFAYPDEFIGWQKSAVERGCDILSHNVFHAIISSSSPPTSHLIASKLKNKFHLPWIADMRDLWTQNHYYQYGKLRKAVERRLELKTLSTANGLITVSQPLAMKLKELHKDMNVYVIPNGFDPAQKNPGIPLRNKFTITYTGALYRGRRDPEPLFEVLRELSRNNMIDLNDFAIDFYGQKEEWLEEDILKHDLKEIAKVNGLVSREEAIQRQRESQLLLLLTWNNPNEIGVYTGKIFDYLAAQRPILSMGVSGGVVQELLETTHAGKHVSDINEITQEIINRYHEFKSNGKLLYKGIPSEIDKYSHKEMARKFALILDNLTSYA